MATRATKKAQRENLLDTIHTGQSKVVDLAHELTDTVGDVVPEVWNEPIAEGIPAAASVADTAFKLVHGIIDAQHEMTVKVVASVADGVRSIVGGDQPKRPRPAAARPRREAA